MEKKQPPTIWQLTWHFLQLGKLNLSHAHICVCASSLASRSWRRRDSRYSSLQWIRHTPAASLLPPLLLLVHAARDGSSSGRMALDDRLLIAARPGGGDTQSRRAAGVTPAASFRRLPSSMMTMVSPRPSAGRPRRLAPTRRPRRLAPSARPLILLAAPSLLALVGTHVCVFLDKDEGEEKTVRGEEVNSRVKKITTRFTNL